MKRIVRIRHFSVIAIALFILAGPANGVAVDMFLDLGPDIPGESKDPVHGGKVDVLAWSWGMNNAVIHGPGGSQAGDPNFQDISLTKWVDKASPKLMLACARGDTIPEAKLIVRKAGVNPMEYIRIKLINAMVTSVSTGGSAGEDRLTEIVSLTFEKVEYEYVAQKPDGTPETQSIWFKWDVLLKEPY